MSARQRSEPLEQPRPLFWDHGERPCRVCKQPTHWRTRARRGAAIHPACEPRHLERLTARAYVGVVGQVARVLGGTVLADNPPLPQVREQLVLGPCAWCGQEGLRISRDDLFHCKAHLWVWWPPQAGPR